MKITVEAKEGKITAVTEDQAAVEPNPELEQAKNDLAAANATIEALKSQAKEHEDFKEEVTQKLALFEKSFKAAAGSFVPQGRTTDFGKGKETPSSITKDELRKRKESYKQKTK
jgi:hypothetical protein